MSTNYEIRKAKPGDFIHIYGLIQELAKFEKLEHRLKQTADEFTSDGASENAPFKCLVATHEELIVGYVLYFTIYSTFEGKALYMEDLYVTDKCRGQGVGTTLYKAVAKEALDTGCCRLDFIVINWNDKALEFYKKYGAEDMTKKDKWHLLRMEREAFRQLTL